MTTEFEQLFTENYVMLTTFRKSGDAVSIPIWAAADNGELLMWTVRDSGKVKRLRNSGRVEVQACDVRGKNLHGPKVAGEARLLDGDDMARVRKAISRKYWLLGRAMIFFGGFRSGDRNIGIAVKPA
jgi:PPOX class probable F420-dependent enzyme